MIKQSLIIYLTIFLATVARCQAQADQGSAGQVLTSTGSGSVWSNAVAGTNFSTQTSNTFFAGPTSGSAAAPSFRALSTNDFPVALSAAIVTAGGGGSSGANTNLSNVNPAANPTFNGSGITNVVHNIVTWAGGTTSANESSATPRYFALYGLGGNGGGSSTTNANLVHLPAGNLTNLTLDVQLGGTTLGANTNFGVTLFINGLSNALSCNVTGDGSLWKFSSDTTHSVFVTNNTAVNLQLWGNNPSAATSVQASWSIQEILQ